MKKYLSSFAIGIMLLSISFSVRAESSERLSLPKGEQEMRQKIGEGEYKKCLEQEGYRSCWSLIEEFSTYEEKTNYSQWNVRCKFLVTSRLAHRRCWIGGYGISIGIEWHGKKSEYKFNAFVPGNNVINSFAPVHVQIDTDLYVSPEDTPYGEIVLETASGAVISSEEFLSLIASSTQITTIVWDEEDREYSTSDRGEGFSKAHRFVIGFLDRTE